MRTGGDQEVMFAAVDSHLQRRWLFLCGAKGPVAVSIAIGLWLKLS